MECVKGLKAGWKINRNDEGIAKVLFLAQRNVELFSSPVPRWFYTELHPSNHTPEIFSNLAGVSLAKAFLNREKELKAGFFVILSWFWRTKMIKSDVIVDPFFCVRNITWNDNKPMFLIQFLP